jgi:hypothetical protein
MPSCDYIDEILREAQLRAVYGPSPLWERLRKLKNQMTDSWHKSTRANTKNSARRNVGMLLRNSLRTLVLVNIIIILILLY